VYVKNRGSVKLFIAFYVDDLLLFSNDENEKFHVKNQLMSKFGMKYFGEAINVLGIRVRREEGKLFLDQKKYIDDVLIKFYMTECKAVGTPYVVGDILECSSQYDDCSYQEIIGCVIGQGPILHILLVI
jgi:hypothetical protein